MNYKFLTTVIKEIIELDDRYGESNIGNNEKVNVEFVSANPTGDLHLGHARGAVIGDVLCRIWKRQVLMLQENIILMMLASKFII